MANHTKHHNGFIRRFIAYILILSFGLTATPYADWESVSVDGGYADTASTFFEFTDTSWVPADEPYNPGYYGIRGWDLDEDGDLWIYGSNRTNPALFQVESGVAVHKSDLQAVNGIGSGRGDLVEGTNLQLGDDFSGDTGSIYLTGYGSFNRYVIDGSNAEIPVTSHSSSINHKSHYNGQRDHVASTTSDDGTLYMVDLSSSKTTIKEIDSFNDNGTLSFTGRQVNPTSIWREELFPLDNNGAMPVVTNIHVKDDYVYSKLQAGGGHTAPMIVKSNLDTGESTYVAGDAVANQAHFGNSSSNGLASRTHSSRDNVDSNKLYFTANSAGTDTDQTDLVVDSQGNVIFADGGDLFSVDLNKGKVHKIGSASGAYTRIRIDADDNLYMSGDVKHALPVNASIQKLDYTPITYSDHQSFDPATDTLAAGRKVFNTITGTEYDSNGLDYQSRNENGQLVYHYDANGFRTFDGIHRDTGTEFDDTGLTITGTEYNAAGINQNGLNAAGEAVWVNQVVEAPKLRLIDRDQTHDYGDFLALDNNGDLIFTDWYESIYPSNQNLYRMDLATKTKTVIANKTTHGMGPIKKENISSFTADGKIRVGSKEYDPATDTKRDWLSELIPQKPAEMIAEAESKLGITLDPTADWSSSTATDIVGDSGTNLLNLNATIAGIDNDGNIYLAFDHQDQLADPFDLYKFDSSGTYLGKAWEDPDLDGLLMSRENLMDQRFPGWHKYPHCCGFTHTDNISPDGQYMHLINPYFEGFEARKNYYINLTTGTKTKMELAPGEVHWSSTGFLSGSKQVYLNDGTIVDGYGYAYTPGVGVHAFLTANLNPVTMTVHDTDYGTGRYRKNWMQHPAYGQIGDMVQADDGTIYATHQKDLLTYEMYVGGRFLNIHDPASGLAAINSVTGSEFDETGLTITGSRFGSDGFDAHGADEWGFDRNGNVAYDDNGFSLSTGLHLDTGTAFNSGGFTQNGTKYDDNGYNVDGFNLAGLHLNGSSFDDSGFDVDGYDISGVAADGNTVKSGGHSAKSFEMAHSVPRQSFFKTIVENNIIHETGQTKLGSFIVRNNTKDGFEVSIESATGGSMTPASNLDGEQPIAYGVSLSQSGTIGPGITYIDAFSDTDLANGSQKILARPGSEVQAGTDATFDLFIDIDQTQSDALNLAGTYSDTITLTYTDK